jgi:hypothetical protein
MGLASHGNGRGAKACLQTAYPGAFSRASGLADARAMMHVDRAHTAVVVDGNVMLRQVPSSVTKMNDYVFFVWRMVSAACSAGERVVVVFDEAAHTTRAKIEEQARRDSTRAARYVAPEVASLSDDFDASFLENFANVNLLMDNRVARERFIDEVCRQVNERLQSEARKFFLQKTLLKVVFDGVDPRGAARPRGVPRAPQMSGDPGLLTVVQRSESMGEGDLKMRDVAYRIHCSAQAGEECAGVKMILHSTIDTDALPILMLLEDRLNREFALGRTTRDVIAFKEQQRPKRKSDDDSAQAGDDRRFLLCDVCTLYNGVVQSAFPHRDPLLAVSADDRRRLFALFALSAAVSGCDFMLVKGTNFQDTLEGAFRMIRNNTTTVSLLDDMCNGDEGTLLNMTPLVKELLEYTSGVLSERPRMGKASANVRDAHPDCLRRAVFCASYWSANEQKNTPAFGFVPLKG